MARLGMIDWGIGGIGIYREIRSRMPELAVDYFSDTGSVPYGKLSREELVRRLRSVIEFLGRRGCDHVLIACNAASTAIPDLESRDTIIGGVIEPAIEMTSRLRPAHLGVIGGRRTILSGVYRRSFVGNGIRTSQRIAQPLSALIERGEIDSPELVAAARRILSPIRNCTHILLACTHYPAIGKVIASIASPATILIDPADAVTDLVAKWSIDTGDDGGANFMCTGDAYAMPRSAMLAWSVEITKVDKIRSLN